MENLLQQEPAQTLAYMVAGFAVIFGMISAYLLSLFFRLKSVEGEIKALSDSLEEDTPNRI